MSESEHLIIRLCGMGLSMKDRRDGGMTIPA